MAWLVDRGVPADRIHFEMFGKAPAVAKTTAGVIGVVGSPA